MNAPDPQLTSEDRMWGMLCHLTAFSGYIGVPFGNIIGPLVVWLVKKEEMAFVDYHGKESLNFQISMLIYLLISGVSIFAIVGIVLFPAVLIAGIVLTIIAAIKANGGEYYEYPLTIRFFK